MAFTPGTTVKHKASDFKGMVIQAQTNRSELFDGGTGYRNMPASMVASFDTGEIRMFLNNALEVVDEEQ